MQTAYVHSVWVKTDGAGAATKTVNVRGQLLAVGFEIGDLSTPDIAITDEPAGTSLLAVAGVAADTVYYPTKTDNDVDGSAGSGVTPQAIFGHAQIAITGGGAAKEGIVRLLVG